MIKEEPTTSDLDIFIGYPMNDQGHSTSSAPQPEVLGDLNDDCSALIIYDELIIEAEQEIIIDPLDCPASSEISFPKQTSEEADETVILDGKFPENQKDGCSAVIIDDELIIKTEQETIIDPIDCPASSDISFPKQTSEEADDTVILDGKSPENQQDEKSFSCANCNYTARKRSYLKNHMRIHTDEKPHICGTCDYRGKTRTHLKKHMRIHTGEKPYVCTYCDFRATQQSNLVIHMRTHTGEKPFPCDSCDYRAARLCHLQVHMFTTHQTGPFNCESCDFTCLRYAHLKIHKRSHNGEMAFACDLCDYRSTRMSFLELHKMSHSGGARPHACDSCDYRAARPDQLVIHKRNHTGEKPYACDSCDYRAAQIGQLVTHKRNHTGERPYGCGLCDYRSAQLGHVQRHIRVMHKGVDKEDVIRTFWSSRETHRGSTGPRNCGVQSRSRATKACLPTLRKRQK